MYNLFTSLRNIGIHQDRPIEAQQEKSPIKPENQFQATSQLETGSLEKETRRGIIAGLTLGVSVTVSEGHTLLKLVVGSILTSHGALEEKVRKNDLAFFKNSCSNHAEISDKIAVTTAEGAKLDGMILKPTTPSPDPQKYVIWLNGLFESYESKLGAAANYAEETGANVLVFNYRGAGESTGDALSANDFVRDTLSMVQFLTEQKNIKPEDITIHGYSMGGGIGAKAAFLTPGVKHINERSFLAFSKAVKHGIGIQPEVTQIVGITGGKILGSLGALIIRATGFEMNTEKIYKKANESEAAEISNLRERTLVVSHSHDAVITPRNRLMNASNLNGLSSHEFVDLAAKDITYSATAGSMKNLQEVGKFAKQKYEILSFEDYKTSLKKKGLEAKASDYGDFLKGELEQIIQKRETMISDSGVFMSEVTKKEIENEIIELKNMVAKVKDTTHNLSFLESKEASLKIFAFVSGRSLNPESETVIVKEKESDLPTHKSSESNRQKIDLTNLDVQDMF